MIELKVLYCVFLLTFLDSTSQIRPSLHGHNNAFVQDENDVQYLFDNMPMSMHKDFTNPVHGTGNTASEDTNIQDTVSHICFEPHILDFKERQLGMPHQETVTLFNKDHNKTIHLTSISGNSRHFHSSFFQNKVIPPLGNTTFNVVFLGREEGDVNTHLFIHTSDGTLKYQVKGVSISSPYRLRPVVGIKLPLNATFTPLIYIHNPHAEVLQVVEVYSSGGEFQLELPSGEAEGPRELWEIPPYQTKPIIRLHFNAHAEKNHTAYVRFKVNNSAEVLVVAVEVEVRSGGGLHWGGSSGMINLGMGGSLQPPIHYPIALKNSAKKPIKIVNIISTPVSKALKLQFDQVVIPGDTDVPVAIGTMIYDWKTGLDLQQFKGKLMIKAIGPGGSSQKLAIPWVAQVLQGGLEVNASIAHYCSPQSSQARNFSVINKFKLPLAITNVTMSSNVNSFFTISDFVPRVIKPEQKVNIFSLHLTKEKTDENVRMESSILIHSNVSVTEVPLLSYDGKVRKIIPGGRDDDQEAMNFGTVGSGTESEAVFALENQNPVSIELHGWGVNMAGAVLELMGCQSGPADLSDKEFRNITVCSHSGNQFIKPGHLAIFKIKVKTPMIEEDTIVGDVFVRTTYERFTLPVYMRVAHGRISLKKLVFTNCFPGSVCVQQVKVHSTFSRPMEVTNIVPIHKDDRIKYIPLEEATLPVVSKGENHIGSLKIDPTAACKEDCYLGLSLDSSTGSQWLNTMSLPSHTRDSDLNLLNTRYTRFLNSTGGGTWENITMRLDTTEVRGHKFIVNVKPYWPSLLAASSHSKNKSILMFPLTQAGNTSYKTIKLHNPSTNPLLLQLVMDWSYPQGTRLYHSLPIKFKPMCADCPVTIREEFKLEESTDERKWFEKEWNITPAPQTLPLYLNPLESKLIRLSYSPSSASSSSALMYIRNNMTMLEVIRLIGRGAHAQFRFGNRKPGSKTPLLFELAEKHLKDCERNRSKWHLVPNLTVKRSFTARNTGELPIDVYGFYINGLQCEGYGFKVLNCLPFKLIPNATKKIEIAFTPDFTLSRVERELFISTSLRLNDSEESGRVRLSLLATLPVHALESCSYTLMRPSWERAVQWGAISLSSILIICIFAASILEADRILRGALTKYLREEVVRRPLDLRLLSHVPLQSPQATNLPKDKNMGDEKTKNNKKEEPLTDWSMINGKKAKDKDLQKGLKIPDWSVDEERRFRLDTVAKDLLSFKRCEETFLENGNNVNAVPATKKKNGKKQNKEPEVQSDNNCTMDIFPDIQATQDKKYAVNSSTKSSPVTSRNGKSASTNNVKEETKLVDHEVQVGAGFLNVSRDNKTEGKRKHNGNRGNSRHSNNHASFKKFDSPNTQKNVQLSEEETSSTTTESSTHDDAAPCKGCEQTYAKPDKLQRKPVAKKTKPQTIPTVPSVDYRDNYEGDCDDDEYDKERHDNPNRWKTNTTRSTGKHHVHISRTVESSYKLTRPNKNAPRKEKPSQKRRVVDKTNTKPTPLSNNTLQKEDVRRTVGTIVSPLPPPPVCWGENRAKFSDVVARSQETSSSLSNLKKLHKGQMNSHHLTSTFTADVRETDYTQQQSGLELSQMTKEYKASTNTFICGGSTDNEKSLNQELLTLHKNPQHSNSYFIHSSTFTQPLFERELVPYDDLPETDEPLVELESPEEDTRSQLWEDSSPMINLLPDNVDAFQFNSSKSADKVSDLSNTLRDNWVTLETNWEPLYTRTAVGEERSGVWGINTGGVWAAAPWGAAAPPSGSQSTLQSESDAQGRSGFDPFRSLTTIWTPSSTESWKKEHDD